MYIKKVVVIGSGTMGSGIAAQIANADIDVTLLDLPSKEGSRNQIIENAKERIKWNARQTHLRQEVGLWQTQQPRAQD